MTVGSSTPEFSCEANNQARMKKLEKRRQESIKKSRIEHKKRRSIEQSQR